MINEREMLAQLAYNIWSEDYEPGERSIEEVVKKMGRVMTIYCPDEVVELAEDMAMEEREQTNG